ncbi:MAG: DegT/DnrJ/EryC1/StrS family aminotransferase [Anaerolineales bacterium]|jgi:dTDP-4-amino-4,6-dideoxygalactose transaminase|nr:DegT/DnrJ/EryC1/StrS family aminotransferase [Anaerolineales bacterium]
MTNRIPLVDLKAQYQSIKAEIDAAIERVIRDTAFIMGPDVFAFEADFARFCGAKYCIAVASGTSALQLALLACDVGTGDEVITVAHTFTATAESIVQCQATPVFIDIDPSTYLMDPMKIEAAITPKTKAIVPVHLYGRPARMDLINAVAQKHGLMVVEDAAQAHGAQFKGQTVGVLGDAASFSFYPGKNLGAYGDAGAVTTDNEKIAQKIRMLRDHGRFESKYEHQIAGFGERMDTIQAAILKAKLPHLSDWTTLRRKCAKNYFNLLRDLPIQLPEDDQNTYSVYHLFVIRLMEHRDKILSFLQSQGVGAGIHYPIPLHLQPAYQMLGYKLGDLPNTEKAAAEVLSLPIYPELEEANQEYIYRALLAALDSTK